MPPTADWTPQGWPPFRPSEASSRTQNSPYSRSDAHMAETSQRQDSELMGPPQMPPVMRQRSAPSGSSFPKTSVRPQQSRNSHAAGGSTSVSRNATVNRHRNSVSFVDLPNEVRLRVLEEATKAGINIVPLLSTCKRMRQLALSNATAMSKRVCPGDLYGDPNFKKHVLRGFDASSFGSRPNSGRYMQHFFEQACADEDSPEGATSFVTRAVRFHRDVLWELDPGRTLRSGYRTRPQLHMYDLHLRREVTRDLQQLVPDLANPAFGEKVLFANPRDSRTVAFLCNDKLHVLRVPPSLKAGQEPKIASDLLQFPLAHYSENAFHLTVSTDGRHIAMLDINGSALTVWQVHESSNVGAMTLETRCDGKLVHDSNGKSCTMSAQTRFCAGDQLLAFLPVKSHGGEHHSMTEHIFSVGSCSFQQLPLSPSELTSVRCKISRVALAQQEDVFGNDTEGQSVWRIWHVASGAYHARSVTVDANLTADFVGDGDYLAFYRGSKWESQRGVPERLFRTIDGAEIRFPRDGWGEEPQQIKSPMSDRQHPSWLLYRSPRFVDNVEQVWDYWAFHPGLERRFRCATIAKPMVLPHSAMASLPDGANMASIAAPDIVARDGRAMLLRMERPNVPFKWRWLLCVLADDHFIKVDLGPPPVRQEFQDRTLVSIEHVRSNLDAPVGVAVLTFRLTPASTAYKGVPLGWVHPYDATELDSQALYPVIISPPFNDLSWLRKLPSIETTRWQYPPASNHTIAPEQSYLCIWPTPKAEELAKAQEHTPTLKRATWYKLLYRDSNNHKVTLSPDGRFVHYGRLVIDIFAPSESVDRRR